MVEQVEQFDETERPNSNVWARQLRSKEPRWGISSRMPREPSALRERMPREPSAFREHVPREPTVFYNEETTSFLIDELMSF